MNVAPVGMGKAGEDDYLLTFPEAPKIGDPNTKSHFNQSLFVI